MRRLIGWALGLVLIFSFPGESLAGYASPAVFPPQAQGWDNPDYSPLVAGMISQVGEESLRSRVGELSGEWPIHLNGEDYTIATRYTLSGVPIRMATEYALQYFQNLGLQAGYHLYDSSYGSLRNVIAEQPGTTHPSQVFLLTAHLDSTALTGPGRMILAPGADDNASGSAAVMEVAEILSHYRFDYTLRYALFTGEEQGLTGSWIYAAEMAQQGEQIIGVLNMDMVAYNSDSAPIFDLYTDTLTPASRPIAELVAQMVSLYNLDLVPNIFEGRHDASYFLGTRSDNRSFWEYGYPAILMIEDDDDFTPYYHTANDRLDSLNIPYYAEMTRAALGAFAHMGQPVGEKADLTGLVRELGSDNPVTTAHVSAALDVTHTFTATTDAGGAFQVPAVAGVYTVTVSAAGYAPQVLPGVTTSVTSTLQLAVDLCAYPGGVSFIYAPSSPQAGETVYFTATLQAGSAPLSYQWDFGDGQQASGPTASHVFDASGPAAYPVRVAASNTCGQSQPFVLDVLVNALHLYLPFIWGSQ